VAEAEPVEPESALPEEAAVRLPAPEVASPLSPPAVRLLAVE
jgi:hypothetical protein